ncbi:MAG: M28 family peptidase [Candidatus Glassbacteria bacterium]
MKFAVLMLAIFLSAGGCSDAKQPGSEAYAAFEGSRALEHVRAQVGFGPRVPGTAGHAACRNYLTGQLSQSADSVWSDQWVHVTSAGDTLSLTNIGAVFNPAASRRVLLCAHWDTRPRAEHDPDPASRDLPIPGANDGASGAAVLVELARIFGDNPPDVGVDIVLFDGEDYGDFYAMTDVLLGSTRFAAAARGYRPALGVLLDMVGDSQASFPYEGNSWSWVRDQVQLVWDTADRLGYGRIFVRQLGPSVIDDHYPLLQAGIPCIDIIQMGLPYWHTQADTPDKLSAASLEAVGRTLAAVVYGLGREY